jgi:hypothetical protein
MAEVKVRQCDIAECRQVGDHVSRWSFQRADRRRAVDLCTDHEAPIEAVLRECQETPRNSIQAMDAALRRETGTAI